MVKFLNLVRFPNTVETLHDPLHYSGLHYFQSLSSPQNIQVLPHKLSEALGESVAMSTSLRAKVEQVYATGASHAAFNDSVSLQTGAAFHIH